MGAAFHAILAVGHRFCSHILWPSEESPLATIRAKAGPGQGEHGHHVLDPGADFLHCEVLSVGFYVFPPVCVRGSWYHIL